MVILHWTFHPNLNKHLERLIPTSVLCFNVNWGETTPKWTKVASGRADVLKQVFMKHFILVALQILASSQNKYDLNSN